MPRLRGYQVHLVEIPEPDIERFWNCTGHEQELARRCRPQSVRGSKINTMSLQNISDGQFLARTYVRSRLLAGMIGSIPTFLETLQMSRICLQGYTCVDKHNAPRGLHTRHGWRYQDPDPCSLKLRMLVRKNVKVRLVTAHAVQVNNWNMLCIGKVSDRWLLCYRQTSRIDGPEEHQIC